MLSPSCCASPPIIQVRRRGAEGIVPRARLSGRVWIWLVSDERVYPIAPPGDNPSARHTRYTDPHPAVYLASGINKASLSKFRNKKDLGNTLLLKSFSCVLR